MLNNIMLWNAPAKVAPAELAQELSYLLTTVGETEEAEIVSSPVQYCLREGPLAQA